MITIDWHIWLILGLLPYKLQKTKKSLGVQMFEARAIFWWVKVKKFPDGHRDWTFQFPLIDLLRKII